ncbi:hypothetical protein [Cupriavidus necator]
MPTAINVLLSNALLSTLVANAIKADKDLPDYIVEVLGQAVSPEKPAAPTLEDAAEALYEVIADARVASTIGQAWQERYGNWGEFSPGMRIQVGLRFKKLLARVTEGTRQPPGGTLVVLERIGETAQGQAIYGKPEWSRNNAFPGV